MSQKKRIDFPPDVRRSLRTWANKEADEDNPSDAIFGFCCHRLSLLNDAQRTHWFSLIKQPSDWTELFTAIGPP